MALANKPLEEVIDEFYKDRKFPNSSDVTLFKRVKERQGSTRTSIKYKQ